MLIAYLRKEASVLLAPREFEYVLTNNEVIRGVYWSVNCLFVLSAMMC